MADRLCEWCKGPIDERARVDSKFCCKRCRQAGWRLSGQLATDASDAQPKRLAYADPPYLGCAELYRDQPTYAGEVDHTELIERLRGFDGWALSCSSSSLRELLPLCPKDGVRVCGWGKPNGVSSSTRGPHNTWEALIVSPARWLRPGFRDWLLAKPARKEGTLIGRKPIAFVAWLFQCLGADPAIDELADLFPGTGIVGRAWAYASLLQLRDASPKYSADALRLELEREPSLLELCDASAKPGRDASFTAARYASPTPAADASPGAGGDASLRAARGGCAEPSPSSTSDGLGVVQDLGGRVVNLEERRLRAARA